jgi:hypothetical protein
MIDEIKHAARTLADAQARADKAHAAHKLAAGHEAKVRERIAALDAERAEIVSRRPRGDQRDGDAGRLAILAADIEGLGTIACEAAAETARLMEPAAAARNAVAAARVALTRIEATAVENQEIAHVRALEEELLATVARLAQHRAALGGGRPAWWPSADLRNAMQRLVLNAGSMAR